MDKFDCRDCKEFSVCKEPCERAEEYVSQDHHAFIGPIFLRDPTRPAYSKEPCNWADMQGEPVKLGLFEWRQFVKAIHWMTFQQKICLWHYFWRGKTLDYIASKFNLNPVTVYRHILKAKKHIARDQYKFMMLQNALNKNENFSNPIINRLQKESRKKTIYTRKVGKKQLSLRLIGGII